jgi:hypothetical protein
MKETLLHTEDRKTTNLPVFPRYMFQQVSGPVPPPRPAAGKSNPDNVLIMSDK